MFAVELSVAERLGLGLVGFGLRDRDKSLARARSQREKRDEHTLGLEVVVDLEVAAARDRLRGGW
jgi:hypothetical protein